MFLFRTGFWCEYFFINLGRGTWGECFYPEQDSKAKMLLLIWEQADETNAFIDNRILKRIFIINFRTGHWGEFSGLRGMRMESVARMQKGVNLFKIFTDKPTG